MNPYALQLIDLKVRVRAYCGCNFARPACIIAVSKRRWRGHTITEQVATLAIAFPATEDTKAMICV